MLNVRASRSANALARGIARLGAAACASAGSAELLEFVLVKYLEATRAAATPRVADADDLLNMSVDVGDDENESCLCALPESD